MDDEGQSKDAGKPRSTKAVNRQNELREKLGDELRSLYDSVLNEPLPDSMMSFLRDLDREDDDRKDQDKQDSDDSDS